MRTVKIERFLLPCPLPLPRARGGPAQPLAPALVLQVVGQGPWHHCQVLWGKDAGLGQRNLLGNSCPF